MKNAFSLLEMILSLALLSVVATFLFRYTYIFYTHYDQTRDIYTQEIDLDRSLLLIANLFAIRIQTAEFITSQKGGFALKPKSDKVYDGLEYAFEFAVRDEQAFRGYFDEDKYGGSNKNKRFRGYSGYATFDRNETHIHDFLISSNSRLDAVNEMYPGILGKDAGMYMIIDNMYTYADKITNDALRIGWGKKSVDDAFVVQCRATDCFNPVQLKFLDEDVAKDFFTHPEIVKKTRLDTPRLEYHLLKEGIAFIQEGDALVMYDNFTPWKKEKKIHSEGDRHIVMKNVKSFSFSQTFKKLTATSYDYSVTFELCSLNGLCKDLRLN